MRIVAALSMPLLFAGLFAGALSAQYHIGVPVTPGNAVFPAGTPATNPNITRVTPNAVHPASGPAKNLKPAKPSANSGIGAGAIIVPMVYPVYIGSGYADTPAASAAAPAPADSVQAGPVRSAIIDVAPQADTEPNPEPVADRADDQPKDTHYLIALKDHNVYDVLAYWVDGDTLHYFTQGNVHNQASLTLVDREVTARLNKDNGLDVSLLPEK